MKDYENKYIHSLKSYTDTIKYLSIHYNKGKNNT